MRFLAAALMCSILFARCANGQTPTSLEKLEKPEKLEKHWTIDGVERTALIYSPASAATTPAPVVFAFHGHGGTMRYAARNFNFQAQWPEAIVVYMQGLPTPGALTDPQGSLPGWQKSGGDQNDRDLKFFDAVLSSIKSSYRVDSKRIFATGHSNGGSFTYVLWAERGDAFAAFAPVAAAAGRSITRMKPKPAMHIAGTRDPLVRFPMQRRTMDAVRKLNGCTETGTAWATSGTLLATKFESNTGTPLVEVIYPGTHTYPKEAPELIVKFFKEVAPTGSLSRVSHNSHVKSTTRRARSSESQLAME